MSSKKILVIEDDADTRLGLQIRLKASGYVVALAADATSSVMVANRERPDLILLDLGLPGGDGFLVLQRFKAHLNLGGVPIFVLTARDPRRNARQARELGAAEFFQKPVENDELIGAIRRTLGE